MLYFSEVGSGKFVVGDDIMMELCVLILCLFVLNLYIIIKLGYATKTMETLPIFFIDFINCFPFSICTLCQYILGVIYRF